MIDLKNIIPTYNINDKTKEEFDNLKLNRFNIKDFSDTSNFNLTNYYVFKVLDLDTNSKTGWYGMCINKEFAKNVKKNLQARQKK